MFREVNLPSHMVVKLVSKPLSDSKVHAFNCNTTSLMLVLYCSGVFLD